MPWSNRVNRWWTFVVCAAVATAVSPGALEAPALAQEAEPVPLAWTPEVGSVLPVRQEIEGRQILHLDRVDTEPVSEYTFTRQLTGRIEFLAVADAGRVRARLSIDSIRLAQSGRTDISATAKLAADKTVQVEATVAGGAHEDVVREGTARELESFLRSLVVQPVEFELDDQGRVHEATSELAPFESLYDPVGVAGSFLVRTLGARRDPELIHALAAGAVVRVPGADAPVDDEYLFEGDLSVLVARLGTRGLATRQEGGGDGVTLKRQFAGIAAGPALVLRLAPPLFPKIDKLAVSDVKEDQSRFVGSLRFDVERGVPSEHTFSGAVFNGSMTVSNAGPVSAQGRRVHLSAGASVKLTWGASALGDEGDGDAAEGAPSGAEDPGPPPLDEVAPPDGPWELAWRVQPGLRLRLAAEQAFHTRFDSKLEGERQPRVEDRSRRRVVAIAEVLSRTRGGSGRRLRVRVEELLLVSEGFQSDYIVHIRAEDAGAVSTTVKGEFLDAAISSQERSALQNALTALYRPLVVDGVTLTLHPDGSVTDIELPEGADELDFDDPVDVLAEHMAPELGGFQREVLAGLIMPRLFVDLPGEPMDVGDEWSQEVVDPRMVVDVALARTTRFSSRASKAMIRDEMEAKEAEDAVEQVLRRQFANVGPDIHVRMGKSKSRGKPVVGKTIYDPVAGLPEMRRVEGRVADVELEATLHGPGGVIPVEMRMRVDYEEKLNCHVLDDDE